MTLAAQDLSFGYPGRTIGAGVSVTVACGEALALLGPNGGGKTTLLRLIAGLERGNGGEILFGHNRVDHLPPGERNIAMVFQSYALYPTMDVARNIGYGLEVRRIPKPERSEKVNIVAKVLEIGHLLLRKPKQTRRGATIERRSCAPHPPLLRLLLILTPGAPRTRV